MDRKRTVLSSGPNLNITTTAFPVQDTISLPSPCRQHGCSEQLAPDSSQASTLLDLLLGRKDQIQAASLGAATSLSSAEIDWEPGAEQGGVKQKPLQVPEYSLLGQLLSCRAQAEVTECLLL